MPWIKRKYQNKAKRITTSNRKNLQYRLNKVYVVYLCVASLNLKYMKSTRLQIAVTSNIFYKDCSVSMIRELTTSLFHTILKYFLILHYETLPPLIMLVFSLISMNNSINYKISISPRQCYFDRHSSTRTNLQKDISSTSTKIQRY